MNWNIRKTLDTVLAFPGHVPKPWLVGVLAIGWLVFISLLQSSIDTKQPHRKEIIIGYMPVISNLAVPILDHLTQQGNGIRFRALKYSSFAEMAASLRTGDIDVAFMIAPLAIVLRQQGEDVKIIYIGNRHESTLVTRKELNIKSLTDLSGKTIAVPMRYSGHNLSILDLLKQNSLVGNVNIVEMNPPDMAVSLAAGSLDAYYVGEPFAAQTLMSGDASLLFYVEDVWEGFICNLAIVRQDLIDKEPDVVHLLVQSAARSGIWARENPREASVIASRYWGQPVDLIEYALTTPSERIVYSQYIPVPAEIQKIANSMKKHNLTQSNDISGLIEDRFAKEADIQNVTSLASIIPATNR